MEEDQFMFLGATSVIQSLVFTIERPCYCRIANNAGGWVPQMAQPSIEDRYCLLGSNKVAGYDCSVTFNLKHVVATSQACYCRFPDCVVAS